MNLLEIVKRRVNISQNLLDTDLDNLLELACNEMHVKKDIIITKYRGRDLVDARFIFFYISRILTNKSTSQIGKKVNRDHSTVIHGVKEVNKLNFLKKKADNILKLFYNEKLIIDSNFKIFN